MLYQIAHELDDALKAQGVPFRVVFGPEATTSVGTSNERIVFDQLIDDQRDQIVVPKTTVPNMPLIRWQAARIRIFARAPVAGAQWHEHAERAEQILDRVAVELQVVVRTRKNAIVFNACGFVSLVDEKGSAVWSGAVYDLYFAIDRGIHRTNWRGEGRKKVVIGTDVLIENEVFVHDATGAGAEKASGG